ncbi:MAG: MBOAT family protein, partial [Firmicutes bacterium]|nr:MBOAT family protein [Bacillota bacterium]
MRKALLVLAAAVNLVLLGVFKYAGFLVASVNTVFHTSIPVPRIALPIGISFYTFQAMSYVIDLYRGRCRVQRNFFRLLLYIACFPQLIAGPIVRYETIADQIHYRKSTFDDFSDGVCR